MGVVPLQGWVGNASNTAFNTIEFALFHVDKYLIPFRQSLSLLQDSFSLSHIRVSLQIPFLLSMYVTNVRNSNYLILLSLSI